MNRGYIRLWRRSLDSGLLKNHNVWIFWTYCLMKATHKPCKAIIGNQEVLLEPGQFVFGRRKASKETSLTEREIRTCLEILKKWENSTIKSTNRFSIITIINWRIYQQVSYENDPQNDQHATNNLPHTITKEHKKVFLSNSEEFRLSNLLLEKILERNPKHKKPDLQKWAKYIDYIMRIDERPVNEIEKVIKWCQNDSFWQNNILSTAKLRSQFDRLYLKMGGEGTRDAW